jgi:hypothetical protein
LTLFQLVEKLHDFVELCCQGTVTGPSPVAVECSITLSPYFFKINFNIIFPSFSDLKVVSSCVTFYDMLLLIKDGCPTHHPE